MKPERLARTVVVPEHIYRALVQIALEYDRLDGVELSTPGCRWDMVMWYLLTGAVAAGNPDVVAASLHRAVNRVQP
jgi:hypothetical protein